MRSTKMSDAELAALGRARFVEAFGGVFEHAPWVAAQAFDAGPFHSLEALHEAMVDVVRHAPRERQLALIRGHPDLVGRAALRGELTAASSAEQASAGLDQCTKSELERFQELNERYQQKFRFPFILAVKGKSRAEILAALEQRLHGTAEAEFQEALHQIARIAPLRLTELIQP
jgi:2-oxo-4-hydroxy-4-carboxy-5-ureidoimidazoline decarboxylase